MKKRILLIFFVALAACSFAAATTTRPKLIVAPDGLPSGHDTPEGIACDLARAFINHDAALFTNTCIKPYGGDKVRKDYAAFLEDKVASINYEAVKKEPSPGSPKAIGKVFAARHLSHDGPASMGHALFNWQDIMFVDVGVFLQNGETVLNRTAIIKDKDGKWYVDPAPSISPMLYQGLNDESPSTVDFTEAHEIEKMNPA